MAGDRGSAVTGLGDEACLQTSPASGATVFARRANTVITLDYSGTVDERTRADLIAITRTAVAAVRLR